MRDNKIWSLFIIIMNVIGVICLIYFAILYLTHDTTIVNPNAMLPGEAWDWAGMALTFGCLPLLAANGFSFLFVRVKPKCVRFLFFIPGIICLVIVYSYWTRAMAAG